MKICLINPPQILHRRFGLPGIFQPLGLLYVAAVLEQEYSVEVIDGALDNAGEVRKCAGQYYLGVDFDEIGERIRTGRPDIVGISVPFSVNEASALKVAEIVKGIDRGIVTVLGGPHPTVRPGEVLSSEYVDYIVIGEGEETFPELISKLETGAPDAVRHVPGIGYKKNGTPVLTSSRPPIQDLDALPFPARHLLSMEKYFLAAKKSKDARRLYIFNERNASVITSRGCPYHCNFCSIHNTMGQRFRARGPENIISEIRRLAADYNIRHINFEDDNLTLDKKRAEAIFDLMIKSRLNLTWSAPNGLRVESLNEGMVEKMKLSGCKRVFVAPESGVQRVVSEIIRKDLDLRKIDKAISLFKRSGICVDGSFVIGLIGETQNDIWETIKYALRLKRLGMDKAGIHIATPYYGTKLYEEARQKGFLRKDLDSSLFSTCEPLIETPEWSGEELHRLYVIANWLVNFRLRDKVIFVFYNLKDLPRYLRYLWRVFVSLVAK